MSKLSIVFIFLFLSSCSSSERLNIITGKTMGTSYSIKTIGLPEIYKIEIDNKLIAINKTFSSWDSASELSLLNKKPINQWIPVSAELFFVISEAKKVFQQTDGYFDVGIGRLIDIWGFGSASISKPPQDAVIKKNLSLASIKYVELKNGQIKKLKDIYINLSAIAKGYAVDEVAKLLKAKKIKNFLVEIGGEVIAFGKNIDRDWIVGIEHPKEQKQLAIKLYDKAIATSGDYRNYFIWQNKRYIHILNPHSGKPVINNLASVSVVNSSAMLADAYATAILAMGAEKAIKFIKKLDLSVILIFNAQHNFKLLKINL